MSAAPVSGAGGVLSAAIAVFQDTTHMKELDQVKAEILSMVTHDLRGSVATIKGLSAEVASSAHDDPEQLESLGEEAERLNKLVGNLLDMSRIEAVARAHRKFHRGPSRRLIGSLSQTMASRLRGKQRSPVCVMRYRHWISVSQRKAVDPTRREATAVGPWPQRLP